MKSALPLPTSQDNSNLSSPGRKTKISQTRTLGPVSDLERHLPPEWWKGIFNSLYLKTDGDVVENDVNTIRDIDLLLSIAELNPDAAILDLCCGQGRHSLELAKRGFRNINGIDRSRYLIRLARKRARQQGLSISFSEGDARKVRTSSKPYDCVMIMGNSFGYFEKEEDDVAVLNQIKRILGSKGRLVLDLVDGPWMAQNFEPRSWEWIDQTHFVNRERSLSENGKRIVSREVITNSEMGVLADQFYAERLYSFEEISTLLADLGFTDIIRHENQISQSTRNQDLGFMANRMFITAIAPAKVQNIPEKRETLNVSVVMGDFRLPDPVKKDGKFNDEDMQTIHNLKGSLSQIEDFRYTYLDNHQTLIQDLLRKPPKFVFNLCDEGYRNQAVLELHIPALLEMLNIPYTGAGPTCLSICYNKSLVRSLAQELGVDVPEETYFDPTDQAATLPSYFPALLKPNVGDSSIGITQNAVVHNAKELIAYLEYLRELLPGVPVLIQEYLPGREFSVGLIGNPDKWETLPILEVDYSGLPDGFPHILSYESKWDPESPYWTNIKYKEARLEDEPARRIVDFSRRLFERLECRDYARFDFRSDASGCIKLLEVNPNPGWCWDGKLNLMAEFAGIQYDQLLKMILNAARERYGLLP